ncbi:MAG TPA: M13 family metallopeptidase N-terminal domain-containing protein, partial [bacterium]|nr:M13 family metallopeptidase N-terminal domain-containing protein [bacterium]
MRRNRTIALSVILLSACAPAAKTPAGKPSATTAAAAAATPAASTSGPLTLAQTGIEPSWMDTQADPCTDFFAYACGGFVKTMEIPADRATWGVTEAITRSNEEFLKGVLEKAASAPGDDPVMKKVGDYYAACMDEDSIEKAGAAPIQPLLDDVAKVKDFPTLATAVSQLHANGVFVLFGAGSEQDFKDATKMIAGLDQSGLGLPDRDYYLKDEGNTKKIRDYYQGHVGRMLALTGMKPA